MLAAGSVRDPLVKIQPRIRQSVRGRLLSAAGRYGVSESAIVSQWIEDGLDALEAEEAKAAEEARRAG